MEITLTQATPYFIAVFMSGVTIISNINNRRYTRNQTSSERIEKQIATKADLKKDCGPEKQRISNLETGLERIEKYHRKIDRALVLLLKTNGVKSDDIKALGLWSD